MVECPICGEEVEELQEVTFTVDKFEAYNGHTTEELGEFTMCEKCIENFDPLDPDNFYQD